MVIRLSLQFGFGQSKYDITNPSDLNTPIKFVLPPQFWHFPSEGMLNGIFSRGNLQELQMVPMPKLCRVSSTSLRQPTQIFFDIATLLGFR